MNNSIIDKLNWRYATKVFDSNKKITSDKLDIILESLRLSASSFGLQPWKFVVVQDQKIKEKLVPLSWNQRQVADASHVLVLCRKKNMTEEDVNHFIDSMVEIRGVSRESLEGYRQMMIGFLNKMSLEQKKVWMKDQVYLALGNLLTVCALLEIDSCPMEGFVPSKYDEVLNLESLGLESVVVCPIGYRSVNDKYKELRKVRYGIDEVVVTI